MCESVDGCEMIDSSGDGSFNLGLGGGPKYSELGASVDVDVVHENESSTGDVLGEESVSVCNLVDGCEISSGDDSFNLGLEEVLNTRS